MKETFTLCAANEGGGMVLIMDAYSLTPGELHSLQMILLEMLLEVDRICKKNRIKYCIIAGTLLGAVRYGGFIPWDDDLDVAMLREEYGRFREACARDLDTDKFFFQDHTTDPYYKWGYGRIRRKNSEFVRIGQEHMKMETGIFLDIFPLDNVPSCYPLRALHHFYCFILRKLLYAEAGMKTGKTAPLRAWYAVLNTIPSTVTFQRLNRLATYWNRKPAGMVRILTFPTPRNRAFGYYREWYEDLADIQFEGHKFPAARDYGGYLTFKYGDYMTEPPLDQRHWHPVSKFKLPED